MADASSVGVTAAGALDSRFQTATNLIFASRSSARDIGVLAADTSSLKVMSQISPQASSNFYKFNFTSGDTIKLALNNLTDTSNLRVQLYDSAGNVVADSGGTSAQQTAYNKMTSTDGYAAANGQYTVKVSYAANAAQIPQSYNLQLFSGTTYSTQLTTSAITQAYDPNLFVSASTTVSSTSNYKLYSRNATLKGDVIPLGSLISDQTELYVRGKLSNSATSEDFSFDNSQSGKVKITLTNKTNTQELRFKVYDSTGKTLIADSDGTDAQIEAYKRITSGVGLQLEKGTYRVNVSQKAGDPKSDINYGLQIDAGTIYSKQYATVIQESSTATKKYSAGDNLTIFSDLDAQVYSRSEYNQIDATAFSAINIGWLRKNVSTLQVVSRLSEANKTNFFKFTLQESDAVKATVKNLSDQRAVRVQIMDSSGYRVIADNQGTDKQKAAFSQFTSDTGLSLKKGDYVLKTSYPKSGEKTNLNYSIDLYSGNTFTSRYKVIASAQNYANYMASGGTFGYSAAGTYASQLQSLSEGGTLDILSALNKSI